jgi:hypothetical protein
MPPTPLAALPSGSMMDGKPNDARHFSVAHNRNIENGTIGQADFDSKCYGRPARRWLLRPTSEAAQHEHGAERNDVSAESSRSLSLDVLTLFGHGEEGNGERHRKEGTLLITLI